MLLVEPLARQLRVTQADLAHDLMDDEFWLPSTEDNPDVVRRLIRVTRCLGFQPRDDELNRWKQPDAVYRGPPTRLPAGKRGPRSIETQYSKPSLRARVAGKLISQRDLGRRQRYRGDKTSEIIKEAARSIAPDVPLRRQRTAAIMDWIDRQGLFPADRKPLDRKTVAVHLRVPNRWRGKGRRRMNPH